MEHNFLPPQHRSDRTREHEGVKYHWCSRCQDFLLPKYFGINNDSTTGVDYVCKSCRKADRANIQSQDEYTTEGAKKVLRNLGYDPDSETSIHQQFLEKNKYKIGRYKKY